jgi:hypothetical protein
MSSFAVADRESGLPDLPREKEMFDLKFPICDAKRRRQFPNLKSPFAVARRKSGFPDI